MVVVVTGLAAGLVAAYLLLNQPGDRSSVPSVRQFSFPTVAAAGAQSSAEPPSQLATEPGDAPSAVALLLQAQVEDRPATAYAVLDENSRRRLPSVAAWARAQDSYLRPLTFEVVGAQASAAEGGGLAAPEGTDVEVIVTHQPSLDPFSGLVPGRSRQSWRARQEGDRWRVTAEPRSVVPILPEAAAAPGAVRAWLAAMTRCDIAGARLLEAGGQLVGPADLAAAPCQRQGAWTVGEPLTFDNLPDPASLLAAFGPDTAAWARVVPVRGPGPAFLAAVAPLGESWRVVGVAPARTDDDPNRP